MRRAVSIKQVKNTWTVAYQDRIKGQRYLAAQFYIPDNTYEKVRQWVLSRPNRFKLIEIE